MTEQDDTKKPGRVKRIFRWVFIAVKWLFVVLLSLLLITGLYFQAPWKVTALIAIILATLTIIPKRTRKWIWLTFGIVIVALVVWVFLPEDDGDWRPYTFDEELAALEAKRTIPDDQNAATIYNHIIETYDANDFWPWPDFMDREPFYNLTAYGPWSSNDHPQLAKWFENCQDIIATLIQVSEKDICRFPISVDPVTLRRSSDRLNDIQMGARLLIRAANNNLGDGHVDKALEKYLAVVQIGKHQSQQSTMIDWFVGFALEAMGIGRVNQLVIEYDLTSEQLETIENSIRPIKNNWASDLIGILETEILCAKNECGRSYEINTEGKLRLNRAPKEHLRKIYPEFQSPGYWPKKLTKSTTILKWFYFPSTPKDAAQLVDDKFRSYYDMAQPDFDWQQHSPESMEINLRFFQPIKVIPGVHLWERIFVSFHDIYLQYLARRRACRLLVGIKRYKMKHGRWPQSLGDVKSLAPEGIFLDPTNNDSFVYRLTESGFTLYSKGKNGIDEGGEHQGNLGSDPPKPDDLLIWPPKSRKTTDKNSKENNT